ncbi:DapH/DapD/GlmU-related protein [Microbacterium karelineae]|uniref:DapH/DapD/GlmU-related protein n=1 Tax=Microbacterium karelineae TaxID=2654283 RepID=UPI001E2DA3C5|nr:DapH/DapD/GlmU-related protein [Microbacterium karelineae]
MVLTTGEDARIHKQVQFLHNDSTEIRIGDRPNFYRGTEIMAPVTIGDDVFINRDAYIRPQTTIGDRVNIGPFVRIVTDTHDIGPHEKRAGAVRHDPISIGDGSWIGASSTILGGVTIGAGSIVAAGSIVTEDVPDDVVVAGVPARIVKRLGA